MITLYALKYKHGGLFDHGRGTDDDDNVYAPMFMSRDAAEKYRQHTPYETAVNLTVVELKETSKAKLKPVNEGRR